MCRNCIYVIITAIILAAGTVLYASCTVTGAGEIPGPLAKELAQIPCGEWDRVKAAVAGRTEPEAYLIRAAAEINLGNLEAGFECFDRIGSTVGYRDLAEQIIPKYSNFLLTDPTNLLYLNCLAFARYALQQYEKSAQILNKIIENDPDNVWIMDFAAFVYGKMGNIDYGLDLLKKSLRIDPSNQYTHLLLSLGYFKKGNYLRSIYHYLRAPDVRRKLQDKFDR